MHPILFQFGPLTVMTHDAFTVLALAVGLAIYYRELRGVGGSRTDPSRAPSRSQSAIKKGQRPRGEHLEGPPRQSPTSRSAK